MKIASAVLRPRGAAWLLVVVAMAANVSAVPAVSSLAEMREQIRSRQRARCDVDLVATVCAADTNAGLLALRDQTGAEVCSLEMGGRQFHPGEIVHVAAANCELIRRANDIAIAAAPVVDNGGIHSVSEASNHVWLAAGWQPIRVFYFNAEEPAVLQLRYSGPGLPEQEIPSAALSHEQSSGAGSAISEQGVRYSCYADTPATLDDLRNAEPTFSGVATNFDISLRRPLDYVAMQFSGRIQIPVDGEYIFHLRCDDGAELYVGQFSPRIEVRSSNAPPVANAASVGSTSANSADGWCMVEGLVAFAGRDRDGLHLVIVDGNQSSALWVPAELSIPTHKLLGKHVRATGVRRRAFGSNDTSSGSVFSIFGRENLTVLSPSGQSPVGNSEFTTASQVQQLSAEEAARQHPVRVRGVVTCTVEWGGGVIQDATRGVFFRFPATYRDGLQAGDFVEIQGVTAVGDFAPTISANSIHVLGQGQLPAPAHPSWNQLMSGSLDSQYSEIRGVITGVESNCVTLLTDGGKIKVLVHNTGETRLKALLNTLVRIRGCLLAEWDSKTRQVRVGEVRFRNPIIEVEQLPMLDAFAAPQKTISDLLLFDLNASGFERVKIAGEIVHVHGGEVFLMQDGRGLRFNLAGSTPLKPGDTVEVVGIPELSGLSPRLNEVEVRKTGSAPLPAPTPWENFKSNGKSPDATLVEMEARLLDVHKTGAEWILELQADLRRFRARIESESDLSRALALGSNLRLDGVYSSIPSERTGDTAGFELLLNSMDDLRVLQRPPWWTLQKLFYIVASLISVLLVAAGWIGQLRRQVAHRTALFEQEHERRERAERERALEMERSRIARDLHDDLGSSLTEIRALASRGMRDSGPGALPPTLFQAIAEKARTLVSALDVIVWAVNPEANSLQSLSDYLSSYAEEYLAASNISCRFKIPVSLPGMILDGRLRHDIFLAVKETLHNIVRHSNAAEVEFQLEVEQEAIRISIKDNGRGFDSDSAAPDGHGLRNLPERLTRMGGQCRIDSEPGLGTKVEIRVPIPLEHGNGPQMNAD